MSSDHKANRQIETKSQFRKLVKKLHPSQKKELDDAVSEIFQNPTVGETKKGDLSGIRVYKFRMQNQQILLAYTYDEVTEIISLKLFGPHENFYRDMKRD